MTDRFEILVDALSAKSFDDRVWAIEELVAMGESAVNRLIALLHEPPFDEEEDRIRKHAAEVLGKIGSKRAFEPLVEATESASQHLQEKALEALGALRDERAIGLLVAHLRHHWNPDIRESAAWALANYPEPWVIRALIRAFSDPRDIVRDAATFALLQIGLLARPDIVGATTSDDPIVRAQALETLAEMDRGITGH